MMAYIGGKKLQSKWISSFIPKTEQYMEVFGGAMWVYIAGNINTEKSIYNDYNKYMYNLFTCCLDYKTLYKRALEYKVYDQKTFDLCQKDVVLRGMNFDVPDQLMAIHYAYISTHIFSGMFKENGKNKMAKNEGAKRYKFDAFRDRLAKPSIQEKFNIMKTSNLGYEEAIEKYDSTDMVMYLDPPYYGTETYYSFHSFGKSDHEKLADILKGCKSKWILSYYDFPQLEQWFPTDVFRYEKKEYSKISSSKSTKNKGEEVLIMNY
jgi:DNA adenine methylase